jgi:hypothetical protein
MTVNGNGMCAIARTPGIAKDTVTDALRNIEPLLWHINYDYLNARKNGGVSIDIVPVTRLK